MRFTFYTLVVLFLVACGGEKKEADHTEEYVEEKVIDYYSDGKIKLEGRTVNGKPHGLWRYYYENGFVWSEGRFRHGERDGHSLVYYENGKKRIQGQFKEGERKGWWLVWNEQGDFLDSINVETPISRKDSLLIGIE